MTGPKVTRSGFSVIPDADYYENAPDFDVGSWCPTSDGSGAPTQVHLRIGKPPGNCSLVRFKSAAVIDAMIDALIEHRENVWGKRSAK